MYPHPADDGADRPFADPATADPDPTGLGPDLTPRFDVTTYTPVPLAPRHDGWTAERQRTFLVTLSQTGRVILAAQAAGMSLRSAWTLRSHPLGQSFAAGWDQALLMATDLLTAIAFERAIAGTPRQLRRDGKIVAEVTQPSDKLLMFLLGRFLPQRFGPLAPKPRFADARTAAARAALPDTLATLRDLPDDLA